MSKGFRRPSKNAIGEVLKFPVKEDYPKKDISFIIACHSLLRERSTDELFDLILGEDTIIKRLEHAFADYSFSHPQYCKRYPNPITQEKTYVGTN